MLVSLTMRLFLLSRGLKILLSLRHLSTREAVAKLFCSLMKSTRTITYQVSWKKSSPTVTFWEFPCTKISPLSQPATLTKRGKWKWVRRRVDSKPDLKMTPGPSWSTEWTDCPRVWCPTSGTTSHSMRRRNTSISRRWSSKSIRTVLSPENLFL